PARPDRFRARAAALAVLPLVLALTTWPFLGTAPDTGTRTVAIVQGNAPNVGIDLLNEAPTLRRNHLQASRELATAIRTGTVPKPDLVVWPESATQVNGPDPTLDAAVADLGAPTLIGSLYRLPTGQRENAVVAWDPATGEGPRYAKQELVPFSEYIPFRTIALWFTPFAATPDLKAGNTPGLFTIAGAKIGVGICYEVAYDAPLRAAAQQGAELLVVPTNNAWFGQGEMTYQQLAMARLRAVEHDRAVIVAATSGVSAIVQPDGTVTKSLEMYTAGSLTAQVPLRTTTTLSDRLGGWAEPTMLLLTAAALTVAALRSRAG
ncbi:apolipoprotein N-acyltransferase, partial [Crossiella equi]